MDSLLSIFFGSFIIGISGAAVPGPMLTVVIRESTRRGVSAGPLAVMGHTLLEIATVAAILMGLGAVMARPLFFGLTGVIGGLILVWMGAGMLKTLPQLRLELSDDGVKGVNPVAGGALTSLSNPYYLLWWATAGLALISRAGARGYTGQAVFFAGHVLADLTWYTLVSAMIHYGRSFLSDGRYRVMIGLLALMLMGFGLYFCHGGAMALL